MTEKLYYQDVDQKEFATHGIYQKQDEDGNCFVVLSETYFYPTGGGQPHDTGTLNGVAVTNVEEIDGEIRHYVEEKLDQIEEIKGIIDWNRRFDHMQQHSGQHILTAAFVELFGFETVSFHLGQETATIDITTNALTEDILQKVEQRANEIIHENHPIETKWVTREEALQYKLRKKLSVTENIRLVIIPDYDYNGCGGTHPTSTGQVSSLKILDWEKQKDKARVQFICGNRVLKHLHFKHTTTTELSRMLSVPEGELPMATNKLLETNKVLGKTIDELREELLQYEANELIASKVALNGEKMVVQLFQNRTIQELQKLARLLTNQVEKINVFFVTDNGEQLQFVCLRDKEASVNMKIVVQQILPLIEGKGGGNETAAQGGGKAVITGEELLNQIKNIVGELAV
ncbi:alanyl-tRNA editing protein [Robertmurraya kyonggiensis]|uniref:Alanyl-tRNA editing protein n=1 Tax=Robertmurraya kyonggiensis TaxID=1037680 RepID=A0A4U1DA11_9BACI|nr:DHHA1 domain-containing protein [Robertmurraya kyonggiensis]TKC19419.1 alanyl-tRNA editing protein [Robertmurraya kyonggiensis]